jgi:hypothetical protein
MTDFDPTAIATIGHNRSPFDAIKAEIEDLFDEAKNFCDGGAIDSPELAAAITELHDKIHAAGQRADDLRIEEKRPLDEQVAAIQTRYHSLIGNTKGGKGKVVLGKDACQSLLTPWRVKVASAARAEADRIAAEAAEATRLATEAIRASAGNLAEREAAEELLADAKKLEKTAARSWKAATTGTGLRTTWRADLVDIDLALDHYWKTHQSSFEDLVRELAATDVRADKRGVPGFNVVEIKVAA